LDWLLIFGALALGVVASIVGGGVSGVWIGGEALGKQLAAFMGGLYGVMAGGLGVVVGLAVLSFI